MGAYVLTSIGINVTTIRAYVLSSIGIITMTTTDIHSSTGVTTMATDGQISKGITTIIATEVPSTIGATAAFELSAASLVDHTFRTLVSTLLLELFYTCHHYVV